MNGFRDQLARTRREICEEAERDTVVSGFGKEWRMGDDRTTKQVKEEDVKSVAIRFRSAVEEEKPQTVEEPGYGREYVTFGLDDGLEVEEWDVLQGCLVIKLKGRDRRDFVPLSSIHMFSATDQE